MDLLQKPTLTVAQDILGWNLVRTLEDGQTLIGRIVETEAYLADDPACHAYGQRERVARGLPPLGRSAMMFAPPATAYVYLNYGIHWLFNIVTEPEGVAGAVLVRALEPVAGMEQMLRQRQTASLANLSNGPGKLTQAMAIDGRFMGHDLRQQPLQLQRSPRLRRSDVVTRQRIGISKAQEKLWRFYLKGNRFVSQP